MTEKLIEEAARDELAWKAEAALNGQLLFMPDPAVILALLVAVERGEEDTEIRERNAVTEFAMYLTQFPWMPREELTAIVETYLAARSAPAEGGCQR